MTTSKHKHWMIIAILLVVVIAAGSVSIWQKYSHSQPIEISITHHQELLSGEIYIGGAVNNPGFYPLKNGDTLEDIIQAAGGTTGDADLNQIKMQIPEIKEGEQPQKVNLNTADGWLLQALPGIGETKAQAIIDYRRQNGHFHDTSELIKVEGIGLATYEKIKDLITVAD